MQTNFLLGELKITEAARIKLKRIPFDLICRHAINEHGHISEKELKTNEHSMLTLGPIVSRYKLDPTDKRSPFVVVKTRATWDETLVDIE